MRVLHIVKTSDGAAWAAQQARELSQAGVDVHVVVPSREGRIMPTWRDAGATIHVAVADIHPTRFWNLPVAARNLRAIVERTAPDLVHAHFVGSAMLARIALGRHHPIPRIFQVPGPLHLEHAAFRGAEIRTSGPRDYWIGSSRSIVQWYRRVGIAPSRLFLSYYGLRPREAFERSGGFRRELGIPQDAIVVGNSNFMYAPKYYLGQRIGLKCHEDVIDAIAVVAQRDRRVRGLLVGGAWAGARWYERQLRRRALAAGQGTILMPGFLPEDKFRDAQAEFDIVAHVPMSENCGGVPEPLQRGTPVIASTVGGLPEVIIPGLTGTLVPTRRPRELARAIEMVLADLPSARRKAETGRRLVQIMFDVSRTAAEVLAIYRHILHGTPRPDLFDSRAVAESFS